MAPGGPLLQGMKIALTGETAHARAELVGRAVAAGLNMVTSVSRHTSVLVTNEPASQSAKARRAAAEGVPVIDEHTFLRLLADVQAGTVHEATAAPAVITPMKAPATAEGQATEPESITAPVPQAPVLPPRSLDATVPAPHRPGDSAGTLAKPLMSRRVLVLGGAHRDAAAARTRVVELGGSAAVNLSASVTDVALLADGENDRRMSRITALELPLHDRDWLISPTVTDTAASAVRPKEPHVLPRGGVIDLPIPYGRPAPEWYVTGSWTPQRDCEIDLVAFILDEDEQVTFDEDLIFYGAPESPAGTVRLLTGGPAEQTIALDLASLPPATRKVVVAAAIDGATAFGTVGAIQISAAAGNSGSPLTRATLDAATTERTMLLAEIYRRGPVWRLRAVGQGYDHGLDALARGYGVDIAD
ncbi:stress response protein SCP2 [Streptomyces turgidiscabies]|uniref:Stress response protein SCP2 n=1 Tax=Streptomyces turgidiscabies TaxID=85558 RepID=A0ABU0RFS0_9ACTN|nr:stress response protein SCP2 [Streptomyces turgidiscabies]